MGRAPCCDKVGLKRGRWTAEEDEILTKYIAANGEGGWRSLPKNAGLLRCGKSCRLRWINYLRSDLKRGNITVEEEEIIVKLHATHGTRWSLIAGHLPGRTDNEIKNYWNSHLSRKVQSLRLIGSVALDLSKLPGGRRLRGGRKSMSTMKKKSTVVDVTAAISPPASQSEGGQSTVLDPYEEMVSDLLCACPVEVEQMLMWPGCVSHEGDGGAPLELSREAPKEVGAAASGAEEEEEVAATREVQEMQAVCDWELEAKLWDMAWEMGPWTMWDNGEDQGEVGLVHDGGALEDYGYQLEELMSDSWDIFN